MLLFSFLFPLSSFLFTSCGGGDDDGRRLGELIVGTWQRGWGEGDVVIEGDTNFNPDDFSYDLFIFEGDGSYNGMIRDGSFTTIDEFGDVIYEGTYRCDNNNLKLEFTDEDGTHRTILAQVLSFSDSVLIIRYEFELQAQRIAITMTLRSYSSSSTLER